MEEEEKVHEGPTRAWAAGLGPVTIFRVGKLRQNIYEAKEETKDDLRPELEVNCYELESLTLSLSQEVKVGKVRSMFSEAEGEKVGKEGKWE